MSSTKLEIYTIYHNATVKDRVTATVSIYYNLVKFGHVILDLCKCTHTDKKFSLYFAPLLGVKLLRWLSFLLL